MGIAPSEFWRMGWREFFDAASGFTEFHGGGDKNKLTAEEADDIVRRGEAMLKRQKQRAATRGD